jgi:hypothetical protein
MLMSFIKTVYAAVLGLITLAAGCALVGFILGGCFAVAKTAFTIWS